jgi:hypothetical protein
VQRAHDVLLTPYLAESARPVTAVEGLIGHCGEPIGGVSQGCRGRCAAAATFSACLVPESETEDARKPSTAHPARVRRVR